MKDRDNIMTKKKKDQRTSNNLQNTVRVWRYQRGNQNPLYRRRTDNTM